MSPEQHISPQTPTEVLETQLHVTQAAAAIIMQREQRQNSPRLTRHIPGLSKLILESTATDPAQQWPETKIDIVDFKSAGRHSQDPQPRVIVALFGEDRLTVVGNDTMIFNGETILSTDPVENTPPSERTISAATHLAATLRSMASTDYPKK